MTKAVSDTIIGIVMLMFTTIGVVTAGPHWLVALNALLAGAALAFAVEGFRKPDDRPHDDDITERRRRRWWNQ